MRDERLLRATSNGLLGLQDTGVKVTDAARFILIRGKNDLCTRIFYVPQTQLSLGHIKIGMPLKVLRIVTD